MDTEPATAPGTLALVGGGEWSEGCSFDAELLAAARTTDVCVLPNAAAYERPERAVARASSWFAGLGASVEALMVVSRPDAQDPGLADAVRRARFLYLSDGSPMHVRSVLKGSAVWAALVEAWQAGAMVAGSGAAAMVLTDPMVDARGGGLTVGLGLVGNVAVVPHFGDVREDVHGEKLHRAVLLAPLGVPVAGVPERTALLRSPDGTWSSRGVGQVTVFLDHRRASDGLGALPAVD